MNHAVETILLQIIIKTHNGLLSDACICFWGQELNVENKMSPLFKYESLSSELVAGVNVENIATQVNHGYYWRTSKGNES